MTQQFSQTDVESAIAAAKAYIAENWGWFLALGIVFILAGIAAIAFPLVSTIAVKVALGWIFLISGVVLVVHAFSAQRWQGFLLELLLGALYIVAGGWLAFFPFTGIITLTLLLAAMFIAEGVLEALFAIRVRPHEGWGWLLFSGVISAAVGVMIAMQLPTSAEWAIGLLAGINLLSTGVSFLFVSLAGRRFGHSASATA